MASTVEIDGHPTWVEDRGGSGPPLLLLHGGLSNSDELLNSIGRGLSESYRVVAFDRRGHGYTADTDAAATATRRTPTPRSTTPAWQPKPSACWKKW